MLRRMPLSAFRSNGFDAFESIVDCGCLMEDDKAGPRPPRPDVSIERAADRTP
jgi:hypothetical protein